MDVTMLILTIVFGVFSAIGLIIGLISLYVILDLQKQEARKFKGEIDNLIWAARNNYNTDSCDQFYEETGKILKKIREDIMPLFIRIDPRNKIFTDSLQEIMFNSRDILKTFKKTTQPHFVSGAVAYGEKETPSQKDIEKRKKEQEQEKLDAKKEYEKYSNWFCDYIYWGMNRKRWEERKNNKVMSLSAKIIILSIVDRCRKTAERREACQPNAKNTQSDFNKTTEYLKSYRKWKKEKTEMHS